METNLTCFLSDGMETLTAFTEDVNFPIKHFATVENNEYKHKIASYCKIFTLLFDYMSERHLETV